MDEILSKQTIEDCYKVTKKEVDLKRATTQSGKVLEYFSSPGNVLIDVDFPEFTCLCPRTSQPDFANINIKYIPRYKCVELKALKYYLNSFRNEGHFHETVITMIEQDLRQVLDPIKLLVTGEFNRRGGMEPTVSAGDDI
jgi:7-cyano-7-deazaguanine reductase